MNTSLLMEVIGSVTMIIVWIICPSIILFRYGLKRCIKNQLIFVIFADLTGAVFQILSILSILMERPDIYIYAGLFMGLSSLMWFIFIERVSHDKISALNFSPLVLLIGIMITILLVDQDSVSQDSSISGEGIFYSVNNTVMALFMLYRVYINIFIFLYYRKINQILPEHKKKYGNMILISFVCYSILQMITYVFLNQYIPGLYTVFANIGIILTTYVTINHPDVTMGLQNKAYRIIVLSNKSGMPIFNYTWKQSKSFTDEIFLSGFFHAVSISLNEIIQSGALKSMKVENAYIKLKIVENYPITCLLIVENLSALMSGAFKNFIALFIDKYRPYLTDDKMTKTSIFDGASELVKKEFYFVLDE